MRSPSLLPVIALALSSLALGPLLSGCADAYKRAIGNDTDQAFSRIFLTDFNTGWQSALEALKASPLDVSNREAGFIQTKWTDNTAQKNFTETFGAADSYLKAQYRVRVTVAKGFYNGKPSVKLSVQKDQLVQRDVLEGWRPIETDSIEEKTLLYRIGRIIYMRTRLTRMEEEKIKKSLREEPALEEPKPLEEPAPPAPSAPSEEPPLPGLEEPSPPPPTEEPILEPPSS